MNRILPSRAFWIALFASTCSLCTIGCGGGDTVDVSGTVSFKGQPVPAGKIYFIPDGSKGNQGQTGYAEIADGKYSTSRTGGKAVARGAVTVTIEAWNPNATGEKNSRDTSGETTSQALFPQYEVKADLTEVSGDKNFDVPAEAAKRPVFGEESGKGFVNP